MKSTHSSIICKPQTLVVRILISALAFLSPAAWPQTTASPPEFPAEAQAITPEAMKERLAGKKFTSRYSNGMTVTLHYSADQALQLDMSTGLSARGTWRVDGAQICMQFQNAPSGCGESKATATQIYFRRYTNQEVIQLNELALGSPQATLQQRPGLRPAFYAVPTDRSDVTMNIALLEPSQPVKRALLVVPGTDGSEGRIAIRNAMDVFNGKLQYLAANADVFDQAGIALVSIGCPTDQLARFAQCDDDYRSSRQYAGDVSRVMALLRSQYGFEDFWIFGHSSGGISSRWLAVNMPDQLRGAIHSSAMNRKAGNLARTMLSFDMGSIRIPMLHIAHEQDECPSTLYAPVKQYSKDNLVTVRGGGQSGHVCGGSNRHSFEGRQRGVSRAIVQWITTGKVQDLVESDE